MAALAGVLMACAATAAAAVPDAGISLRWRIESNAYPPAVKAAQSTGALVIRNDGTRTLADTGWSLWFTSAGSIRTGDVGDHLRIERRNGSLYVLFPTAGFQGIRPGMERVVQVPYSDIVVKDTAAPLGPYLVTGDAPDVGHNVTRYVIEPRRSTEQLPHDVPGKPALLTPESAQRRLALTSSGAFGLNRLAAPGRQVA
ncbi:MAG: carbohydate-binding domain-containing protein [Deltaproteobacteria bacterium]